MKEAFDKVHIRVEDQEGAGRGLTRYLQSLATAGGRLFSVESLLSQYEVIIAATNQKVYLTNAETCDHMQFGKERALIFSVKVSA